MRQGYRMALRMTVFGASRPSRRLPATVLFLSRKPALSLEGTNRSSCPYAVARCRRAATGRNAPEADDMASAFKAAATLQLVFVAPRPGPVILINHVPVIQLGLDAQEQICRAP